MVSLMNHIIYKNLIIYLFNKVANYTKLRTCALNFVALCGKLLFPVLTRYHGYLPSDYDLQLFY